MSPGCDSSANRECLQHKFRGLETQLHAFFEATQNDVCILQINFSMKLHVFEAFHDLDLMSLGDCMHERRHQELERRIGSVMSPQMTVGAVLSVKGFVTWSLSIKYMDRPDVREGWWRYEVAMPSLNQYTPTSKSSGVFLVLQ